MSFRVKDVFFLYLNTLSDVIKKSQILKDVTKGEKEKVIEKVQEYILTKLYYK